MFFTSLTLSFACSVNCVSGISQPYDWQSLQLEQDATSQINSSTDFQLQEFFAQTNSESAESFYQSGVNAHQADRIDSAVQAYQNAIRLNPAFDSAYINLGLAYIQLGQLDNARDTFQRVLNLPDRAEVPASIHTIAYYNLAVILNRQGKSAEALSEIQSALAITPDFGVAQELLQQLQ
jgi:superkiller protein 3